MTAPPDLGKLSDADKDRLILALIAQVAAAQVTIATQARRIAALETRLDELTRPTKDPGHLVQAAVAGPEARPSCARHGSATRKSRPGVGRTLHPNPARVLEARLSACPKCQAMVPHAAQTPQQVYERIELPPIRPDVTQVRLSGGRCACCAERVTAEALPDWSRVRRSAAPSPRWWSICMTLMPSAWNGWPR